MNLFRYLRWNGFHIQSSATAPKKPGVLKREWEQRVAWFLAQTGSSRY
ncbi:hypothetical protein [Acetobacter ascendens]|nr:hypothetical protein [Acetobacter ascendens]